MIAGLLASTFFVGHSPVPYVGRPVLRSAMPSCVSLDRSGISDHRNCTLVDLRQIDLQSSKQANMLACRSADFSCAKHRNLRCSAKGEIVLVFSGFEVRETSPWDTRGLPDNETHSAIGITVKRNTVYRTSKHVLRADYRTLKHFFR